MTVKGFIAVNTNTNEVLTNDELRDCDFNYVFQDVYELCDYIVDKRLKISDYMVHNIDGEVFELTVTTRTLD